MDQMPPPNTLIFVEFTGPSLPAHAVDENTSLTNSCLDTLKPVLLAGVERFSVISALPADAAAASEDRARLQRFVDFLIVLVPETQFDSVRDEQEYVLHQAYLHSELKRFAGIVVAAGDKLFVVDIELQTATLISDLSTEQIRANFRLPADREGINRMWHQIASNKLPRFLVRLWYPMMLLGFAGRRPALSEFFPRRTEGSPLPPEPSGDRKQLANLMLVSGRIAAVYGQKYRSAFVGRFILAAVVSVFAALTLFSHPQSRNFAYGLEFLATVIVILSFVATNRGGWQVKWMTHRYIDDSLRIMLALPRSADHFILANRPFSDDPICDEELLLDWCARQRLGDDEIWQRSNEPQIGSDFVAAVADQVGYHTRKLAEQSKMENRFGKIGLAAFVSSMVLALLSLMGSLFFSAIFENVAGSAALLLGILPAVGAAIFAIRVQSNFRSEALNSELLLSRLTKLKSAYLADPTSIKLQKFTQLFVRLQRQELDQWRKVQLGRALDLP
jgi:hypothetical protein